VACVGNLGEEVEAKLQKRLEAEGLEDVGLGGEPRKVSLSALANHELATYYSQVSL
jgi:hypothetical protein